MIHCTSECQWKWTTTRHGWAAPIANSVMLLWWATELE